MNQAKDFENIIFFPKDIGCTGQAIKENQVIYFSEGKRLNSFSIEVDCSFGSNDVESLLISPVTGSDGSLRGIV